MNNKSYHTELTVRRSPTYSSLYECLGEDVECDLILLISTPIRKGEYEADDYVGKSVGFLRIERARIVWRTRATISSYVLKKC